MKRIFIAALAAFALSACVSPKYVVSDVTRFHTLPSAPTGQSFVIATVDAEQGQSLAFRKYADEVSAKLSSMGLRPAAGGNAAADYVVTLNYGVRGPSPDVEGRSHHFGAGFGYGRGPWGFGAWGEPDWDHYTETRQLFARRVEIDIYRGTTYDTPKKERVFEGRALSIGQNGQLEAVMPYILDALFKEFPGRSGETMRVSIEVPENVAMNEHGSETSSRAKY